ncbi:MAG: carbohydrate ABC transporter permease [Clostridiales bacterium]|nr:carbohydrate ABC transporter permease [Clostridiales bacterium]
MSRIQKTQGDKIFDAVNYALLTIVLVIILYPLIYVFSSSFSSTSAVMAGRVWLLPVEPTLRGYKAISEHKYILSGYANSFYYMFFGTIVNVIMTIMAAYPLSRKDFKARNLIMGLFVFTMFFGGGMIPTYILINQLGLINKRLVMIIPGALSVWNVIITRTYFQTNISDELLEAAQLDGCSDIKFILQVVIPLSGAIIAVITLFYAVGHWNAFFNAFIYLHDKNLFPLQLILREVLILSEIDVSMLASVRMEEIEAREGIKELLKYSLIVAASLPVLCMYPFVQKYFVKGVMIGAIKG